MSTWTDYPVELNGRDAEGRTVYVDADGSAYVELPGEPRSPDGPQPPSGFSDCARRAVPTPEHMRDPVFRKHPGALLQASANGTRCVYLYRQGNPPMPPQPTDCPACAPAWAQAYRDGKAASAAATSPWWRFW